MEKRFAVDNDDKDEDDDVDDDDAEDDDNSVPAAPAVLDVISAVLSLVLDSS